MKKALLLIPLLCISTGLLAKVTYDDALESNRPYEEANAAVHNPPDTRGLTPDETPDGSTSVISTQGECQPASNGGWKTCTLADTSYSCFLSGAAAIGEAEEGYIFKEAGFWKMKAKRGKWTGKFYWTCTKSN